MTGVLVRVRREGRWQHCDIATLTDAELVALREREPASKGWAYAIALARWIRDHVEVVPPEDP